MRTPPEVRTWGKEGAQLIIRQTRPIEINELDEIPGRIEVWDGWLVPKNAGLSNEEKILDAELCATTQPKIDAMLRGIADNLHLEGSQVQNVGFYIEPADSSFDEDTHLATWFERGFKEILLISPWYEAVSLHRPSEHPTYFRDDQILPHFQKSLAEIFE